MRLKRKMFVMFIVAMVAVTTTTAQLTNKALQKTIIISSKEVRIDTLLKIFSRQTGVEFSFNSNKISPSRKLTVPNKNQTLSQWLVTMGKTMGVQHKLVGNHIILIDNGNKNTVSQKNKGNTAIPKNSTVKTTTSTPHPSKNVLYVNAKNSEEAKTQLSQINKSAVTEKNTAEMVHSDSTRQNATDLTANIIIQKNPNSIQQGGTTDKGTEVPPTVIPGNIEKTKKGRASRDNTKLLQSLTKIDLGLQGIGLSSERRLGRRSIIEFSAGLGGGYAITGKDFTYTFNISAPELYLSINPRFYYNTQKRINSNKSIAGNTGNYFGMRLKYVTEDLVKDHDEVYTPKGLITTTGPVWDALLLNVHWGLQRPISKRWLVNAHVGPGFSVAAHYFGYNRIYPSLEARLSYLFKKLE